MAHRPTKDRHHRKPRTIGGTDDPENISIVPRHKHEAWHLLFANYDVQTICSIINSFWLDPEFYVVAIPKRRKR